MTLDTLQEAGLKIEIDIDYDCPSPRDDDVPGCQLVLWGRRYNFPNDAGLDLDAFSGWAEVAGHLGKEHGALVVAPVWVYEHSGIALKAGEARPYPFSDPWDSAQCGVGYVTAKNWADCQGTEWTGSDGQVAKAAEMIKADVETYGQYVNGETYCYAVINWEQETVDSCCGYIGWEAVEEAAREAAKAAAAS